MTEETQKSELKNILEKLQNNAMFRLSLSSKELFHSNFLAWVFDTYKEACKDFFKNINEEKFKIEHLNEILNSKTIKINREVNLGSIGTGIKNENGKEKKKKCIADITIENGDTLVIIENKFKSLPDKQQLEDYVTAINKYNKEAKVYSKVTIILLSYFEPDFDLQESNHNESINIKYYAWSYNDIKLFLETLNKNNKDENSKIINNYIKCIELLNKFKSILCKDIYEHKNSEQLNELKNSTFLYLAQKIKTNHLEQWLTKKFNDEKSFDKKLHNYKPTFRSYFQNSACVDLSLTNGEYYFQIALQGNKYRREFIFNESENKDPIKTYFDNLSQRTDFYWIALDKENEEPYTGMKKNTYTCQFMDGFDRYTYFKIDKFFENYGDKTLSYDNIWEKIKSDIAKIDFDTLNTDINDKILSK